MPTILDDELAQLAPNVTVSVGAPPTYQPVPIKDISAVGIPINTLVDIASKGTFSIGLDSTKNLIDYSRDIAINNNFLVKTYGTTQVIPPYALPPSPSPPPPSPPPPPPSGDPPRRPFTGIVDGIPNLPDDIPFPTINYQITDLLGIFSKDSLQDKKKFKQLQTSSVGSLRDLSSAIYIPKIKSCISIPSHSPDPRRFRNGVLSKKSSITAPELTTYLWEYDKRQKNTSWPDLDNRPDGAVNLRSQNRDAPYPYADILLSPGKWERKSGINNGESLNAFSLLLGLQYGPNNEKADSNKWRLEIKFGDLVVSIFEGKSEIKVAALRSKDKPPQSFEIKPTSVQWVVKNMGENVFMLTFIPVWNGILISDGVPGSSDWGDSVNFFERDSELVVDDLLRRYLGISSGTKKEEDSEVDKDAGKISYPPKVFVNRNNAQYKTPGIFMGDKKTYQTRRDGTKNSLTRIFHDYSFDTGKTLRLSFFHCGGAFQFIPVWFPQYSRYHVLFSGAADPKDLPQGAPKRRPKRDPTGAVSGGPPVGVKDKTSIPSEPDVFQVKSANQKILMPIVNYGAYNKLDFRTHLTTIVQSIASPVSCLSMEFMGVVPDIRRPMQVWGCAVSESSGGPSFWTPPSSSEGFLTVNDVPELKILSFSISRDLGGANGEIVWDRNDPVVGLLPRPMQNVGAIQVALAGGANTIPGIVFTGLAMGNAQENSPDENHVRIPLRGRESKLDTDGGIVLLGAPYFDGMDHRDAMTFLANYGAVPIDTSLAEPFPLISSLNLRNPIFDFPNGTGVNQAMETVSQSAGTIYYFDRFGTLIYFEAAKTTGRNWNYPDLNLEQFSDEPDFQWLRDRIIIRSTVRAPGSNRFVPGNDPTEQIPIELVEVKVSMTSIPTFPWPRIGVYTIPQIVDSRAELIRLAYQMAKGIARPRSASRCQIPGNAQMELHDLINSNWLVTSISHNVDTQAKRWTMNVGVELFVDIGVNVGAPIIKPLPPDAFPE